MSTPYFRNLTRSQYDAFYRGIDGHGMLRTRMMNALEKAGVVRVFRSLVGGGGSWLVPNEVKIEHAAWRSANYHPDGRRIHHRKKTETP